MNDGRRKTVARIFERGKETPFLEAYVYEDEGNPFNQRVKFTDEDLAHALGLTEARIPHQDVTFGVEDGVNYVRNLWQVFKSSPGILGDRAVSSTKLLSVPATMQPRSSERGEPSMDPDDDVEGVYRRFQERKRTP